MSKPRGWITLLLFASLLSTTACGVSITSGPIVTNITETSCSVRWMTDSNAYGLVRYGLTEGSMSSIVSNEYLLPQHDIILSNLTSGTRYWYEAQTTMPDKTSVTSAPAWFETDSTSKVSYVSEAFFLGDAGEMAFSAEFSGTVNKVEFRLDDELIMTDYSFPFEGSAHAGVTDLSPAEFSGTHTVTIEAFDDDGVSRVAAADMSFLEDCFSRTIRTTFNYPWRRVTMYTDTSSLPPTLLRAHVTAYEEKLVMRGGSGIDFGPDWGRIGEELVPTNYSVDHVDFYLDGALEATVSNSWDAAGLTFQTWIDVTGLSTGFHHLRACGTMPDGCSSCGSIDIEVIQNWPEVRVSSTVVAISNRFEVTVTITNVGVGNAELFALDHDAYGFITCLTTSSVPTSTRNSYWHHTRSSRIGVEFTGGVSIAPSGSVSVSYIAIPVLYPDADYAEYGFGDAFIVYDALDESFYEIMPTASAVTTSGVGMVEAVNTACRTSNYLMVTSPGNLIGNYGSEDTDALLTKAAELAVVREAVFGFYDPAVYYKSDWRAGDLCAFGDMFKDAGDELFVGDMSDNRIRAEGAYKRLSVSDVTPPLPIPTAVDAGDDMAVGQLFPWSAARTEHEREELVYADASEGHATVYSYGWDGTRSFYTQKVEVGFTTGCRIVAQQLIHNAAGVDIIIARPGDSLDIYDGETGIHHTNYYPIAFSEGDLIAGGDIIGSLRHQLVFGDAVRDELRVHHFPGPLAGATNPLDSISLEIDEGDALAVGDIRGTPTEEIIFVDESENRVHIFDFYTRTWSLRELAHFEYPFYPGDQFGVAKLFNDTANKLCFVRTAHAGGGSGAGIDIVTYIAGTDEPGDRYGLDRLINTGGDWADRMKSNWSHDGFMLLIGGAEIIPAFSDSFKYYSSTTLKVDFTDMKFASTGGSDEVPELRMGRIIGDSAADMIPPLQTSLDIESGALQLQHQQAMLIHGHDKGVGGGADEFDFSDWVYDVKDVLRDEAGFDFFDVHGTPGGYSQELFCEQATYDDFIFLTGHGGSTSWDAFGAGYVSSNLNIAVVAPVMYAASCLTGRYPIENSFAEACTRNGTAAYIGATAEAFGDYCLMLAEEVCRRLDSSTIGYALRAAQRDVADDGAVGSPRRARRYNASIMHLYGDPAISMLGVGAKSARGTNPTNEWDIMGPVSDVSLAIPPYVIRETNGIHHVRIPGGLRIAEPEKPVVPTYPVRILFPSGYTIQDVYLNGQSNYTQESNLTLPTGTTNIWGTGRGVPAPRGVGGPWPETDFEWTLTDMEDDATLLRITAHPFYYDETNKTAQFYSNFTFSIDYRHSDVWVNRLILDRDTFSAGDKVGIQTYVYNDGQSSEDVVGQIVVLDVTRGITVTVHSLMMDDLQGLGAYTYNWDSSSAEPGHYRAELTLSDQQATIFDRELFDFYITGGTPEVIDLMIAPSNFFIGDDVDVSACVTGTGSEASSGVFVIRVQDVNGGNFEVFQWDFEDLQPGAVKCYYATWSNAPVVARGCRIQAYVLADGASAASMDDSSWEDADFWISDMSDASAGPLVQWWSVPGREYAVCFTTNLLKDFSCIASNIAASSPVNTFTDTVTGAEGFYQVREY